MNRIEFSDPIEPEIPHEKLSNIDHHIQGIDHNKLGDFRVFFLEGVYPEILEHISRTPDIESGGILVGHPFRDWEQNVTYVIIVGIVTQDSQNRSLVHFTVSPEDIRISRDILQERYPGLVPVGWYHSHPGHGVFLSSQDMTIVRSIYNLSYCIALVIDPMNGIEGIFIGPEGIPIHENRNAQIGTLWTEITKSPDCIEAIALFNQYHEYVEARDNPSAVEKLIELIVFVSNSSSLDHWKEKFPALFNLINNSPSKKNLQNIRKEDPYKAMINTMTPARDYNRINDWWLKCAVITTVGYIILVILNSIFKISTGKILFFLSSAILSFLGLFITGYIILSRRSFTKEKSNSPEFTFTQEERIIALGLASIILVINGFYSLAKLLYNN